MAASQTLPEVPQYSNFPISKTGVLTLRGFGVRVRVRCGHLEIQDGVGADRRKIRLPRVGHALRRVVCISQDGFVTLSALKWLADVDASLTMLDRRGKVLFVTGPTASSDARLRRCQALALGNGAGLEISRRLIDAKLEGEERVIRERLNDPATAQVIATFRERLSASDSVEMIRVLEAQAAGSYFGALRNIPVLWPKADMPRIPDHWRTVGSRQSPLTGGPRLAVTPVHAVLNYCFALLEAESRLALSTLGLDPGLGLGLHTDTPNRDSLALDVLEPVRPQVESWVLDWIAREPLRRADFFETATGNCRLMSHLCIKLSETAPVWGKLVAPWTEYVARTLWTRTSQARVRPIPTPLTQQHRREAKGRPSFPTITLPKPPRICLGCGASVKRDRDYCTACGLVISTEKIREVGQAGRLRAQSPLAQASRSETQRRNAVAQHAWKHSSGLTPQAYAQEIQPRLSNVSISAIATALGVSWSYAADIRRGKRRPHARHWEKLARLTNP